MYFLIARDFSSTSVVAEKDGSINGCITGYWRDDSQTCLFIWQVAVCPDYRGHGLALAMLNWLGEKNRFKTLETTIAPSNRASSKLFQSFAAQNRLSIKQKFFLDEYTAASGAVHEKENLFLLSPL